MTKNDALKDGLQNAAWTSLISHHSTEADRRVLEAYKIARVRNLPDYIIYTMPFYHLVVHMRQRRLFALCQGIS